MTTNSEVQVRAAPAGGTRKRRTVRIDREETRWKVDLQRVPELGFNAETAAQARSEFAELLLSIGTTTAANAGALPLPLPADPAEAMAAVEAALTLSEADLWNEQFKLRDIGLRLYNKLSPAMRDALKGQGVWDDPAARDEDLALAVILEDNTSEARTPICWNIIHQDDDPDPMQVDWSKYWGFRLPISQWLYLNRNADIRLPSAFVAVDETLPFTQYEKAVLARLFPSACAEFERLLDAFAYDKLRSTPATSAEADAWWQQNQDNKRRLADVLEKLFPDQFERSAKSAPWKQVALRHIFRNGEYGLLHFACHCEPRNAAADPGLQKRMLSINVNGEVIPIDDATMTNFMARKGRGEWKSQDAGPFVFLNACASGKPVGSLFPDLPQEWIDNQGAKVVIATICDVPDVFAFAFAARLYGTLFDAFQAGRTEARNAGVAAGDSTLYVAEALLATRRYFLEKCNNPLGLAYELYAVPDARLDPT